MWISLLRVIKLISTERANNKRNEARTSREIRANFVTGAWFWQANLASSSLGFLRFQQGRGIYGNRNWITPLANISIELDGKWTSFWVDLITLRIVTQKCICVEQGKKGCSISEHLFDAQHDDNIQNRITWNLFLSFSFRLLRDTQ